MIKQGEIILKYNLENDKIHPFAAPKP